MRDRHRHRDEYSHGELLDGPGRGLDPFMVGKQAQELRQHLTTKVPVLVEYGSADDTIPPGRMACVIDRFKQDKVPYTFCLRPGFGHEGILRQAGSDVVDGIASQTMGEPAPPA